MTTQELIVGGVVVAACLYVSWRIAQAVAILWIVLGDNDDEE